MRRILSLVFLTITAVFLSGCLLKRLLVVKGQLNAFDKNFTVTKLPGDGFCIGFKNPVLLSSDVDLIAGCKATSLLKDDSAVRSLLFLLEKENDRKEEIPVRVDFIKKDGEPKLEKVFIPEKLAKIISSDLIIQCMRSGATSKRNLMRRNVTVLLNDINLNLLPDRSEIRNILGNPAEGKEGKFDYLYKYKVASAGSEINSNPSVSIKISFYKDKPERIRHLSLQYRTAIIDVDLSAKKAVLQLI